MKKYSIIVIAFVLLFFAGCSGPIQDERAETRDKFLISKTKELEIMVQLYELEFSKYPIIYNSSESTNVAEIYYKSTDWQKMKEKLQLAPSLKNLIVELSEGISNQNPIKYYSDGSSYTLSVNLENNKRYNILGTDYQCHVDSENQCVFTISNE